MRRKTDGVAMMPSASTNPYKGGVLIDDLLALCQQIMALGPDHLTPAALEETAGTALLHAAGIVNTIRVPLVVLDATLHVLMANRYFYECFQVTPLETESHRLYDLGNGQWNIPALRHLLEQILPHHTAFDDFEITHTFPHIGPKSMLLASPVQFLLQQVLTADLRAKALVQQILALSRSTPAERTPVCLAVVLRETLPFFRAMLQATIALEEHLTSEASLVMA